ncbi:MAG: glycosyltransferase family 4 protein [Coriobacteriia bacterium]
MIARIAMIVLHDMVWDRRVDRAASALAEAGYEVTVFCLRSADQPRTETHNGYRIERAVPWETSPWSKPLTKIKQSSERKRGLVAAVSAYAPDVVHCHDLPTLEYGVLVRERTGAKVVFDDHELYPDSLMQKKGGQGSAPVITYWRSVEKRFVPQADAVITVSSGIARIHKERYGVKAHVVLNVPERLEPPCARSRLREALSLDEQVPIVLYQGLLLETGRSLVELVDAMAQVPAAHLAVQGSGDGKAAMEARVAERGITERVHFMGWLPTEDLYSYTCGATVGTVFLDGVEKSHQNSLPNRLFLYMMAGVPVAVSNLPVMSEFVRRERIGITANPRDPDSMAAAIRWLIDHPEERAEMAVRGRRLAETTYNWPVQKQVLLDVYADLLKETAKR